MRAWRRGVKSVFRHRGRTVVVVLLLGLSAGMFGIMTQVGAATHARVETLRARVRNLIEVSPAGSVAFEEGTELFPEEIVQAVQRIPHIARVDRYLISRVVDRTKTPSVALFTGLVPGSAVRLAGMAGAAVINPPLVAGRSLRPEDAGKNVALVGRVFARLNRVDLAVLKAGRTVRITVQGPGLPATDLEVVGIYASGSVFGDNQVFLPLDSAQRLFSKQGELSLLLVTVDRVESVERVAQAIKTALGKRADVVAPEGLVRQVAGAFAGIEANSRLGAALSAFLGAVVVLLTLHLVIHERTPEIGMLKAIGASDRHIAQQFAAEVLTLAALGGLVGLTFAALGGLGVARLLLKAGELVTGGMAVSLASRVLVAVIVVAATGSLYPLLQAIRMEPVEAMRHQG